MEPDEIFERQRTEFRRMRGSPHNVVFLDVDGVLNTLAAKERSPMGCIGIQKSKVQILHTILAQNDTVLVLSTSWKRSWSRSVPELSMNEDARYMAEQFADQTYLRAIRQTTTALTGDAALRNGSIHIRIRAGSCWTTRPSPTTEIVNYPRLKS